MCWMECYHLVGVRLLVGHGIDGVLPFHGICVLLVYGLNGFLLFNESMLMRSVRLDGVLPCHIVSALVVVVVCHFIAYGLDDRASVSIH